MKRPVCIILWSIITTTILSTQASELYRWKDEAGKWHFSDRPPKNKPLAAEKHQEAASIKSVKAPKLKPLPKQKVTQGKQFMRSKFARCHKLKKTMRRYRNNSRKDLWDHQSLKKKRAYQWEIQKHC